jgi:hypothetical protein
MVSEIEEYEEDWLKWLSNLTQKNLQIY